MLSVVLLRAAVKCIILSVIMLTVMAQFQGVYTIAICDTIVYLNKNKKTSNFSVKRMVVHLILD
jgi:hypothetical protein